MACPAQVSLCFVAGDTITINWQYTEVDGETAIDLTGATARMQLLDKITDAAQVIDMTGGLTDEPNGIGSFSLTKVQSQALLPIGTGTGSAEIIFVSVINLEFSDATSTTIAGVGVTLQQGGIR